VSVGAPPVMTRGELPFEVVSVALFAGTLGRPQVASGNLDALGAGNLEALVRVRNPITKADYLTTFFFASDTKTWHGPIDIAVANEGDQPITGPVQRGSIPFRWNVFPIPRRCASHVVRRHRCSRGRRDGVLWLIVARYEQAKARPHRRVPSARLAP